MALTSFALTPTRRTPLILAALCALLLTTVYHQSSLIGKQTTHTRPIVTQPASYNWKQSDPWQPPHDWKSEVPVNDNFPSLNERYAVGTNKIISDQQKIRIEQPQPVVQRGDCGRTDDNYLRPVPCRGPKGSRWNESTENYIERYTGQVDGFASPVFGSSSLVGFEQDVCYDRHGRHGVYRASSRGDEPPFNWNTVDWGQLQAACYGENQHRFDTSARTRLHASSTQHGTGDSKEVYATRTAVVLRSHQYYQYTEDAKRDIRAVIQELALHTSGEYAVFLLVEIKDETIQIWNDSAAYAEAICTFVPEEFRNITILWNASKWHQDYPMIREDFLNVHFSQWLPLQYFQKQHPEFDFYWNWEMDVRYTGHYHDLVQSVDKFSSAQPRRGLWERNSRLYMPEVHGAYDQFRDTVQSHYVHHEKDTSIWGPQFPSQGPTEAQFLWAVQLQNTPPVPSPDLDQYSWGVGEPADLVTFLPIFDPNNTNYANRDIHTNYDSTGEGVNPLRRTTIITFLRLSSRLLRTMEMENSTPPMHHMGSESWPHSISIHYGLKAVSIPHPIYMEQQWPTQALDWVFNSGDQQSVLERFPQVDQRGEGAGGPESTFGLGREYNWERSTWYFRNRLAERLYKRWLGWEIDEIGGPQWEHENGRYCLPPMLLHPIKALYEPESAEK